MAQNPPAVTTRPGTRAEVLERMSQRGDELRTAIGRDVRDVQRRAREAFDLRRQITRHPFVAAAVVLGGVVVATRIVQAFVRGIRKSPRAARRVGSWKEITGLRGGTGRGPGPGEAHLEGSI